MDVKFLIKAECRADNIERKASVEELSEELEQVFDEYCDIKAVVEVEGLTYLEG